jgi:hypothetical protein
MPSDATQRPGGPRSPAASPRSPGSRASRPRGRPAGRPRGPTPSTARPPGTRSSPSTPRRPPSRARSTSATSSPTPTPTRWPASSACGARKVFYPMGWDDNGLPTERRVQNYFGVRCDPACPYDPDFVPPAEPPKEPVAVSRPNFVALCHQLTVEDEQVFEHLWRTLGLSVDWSHTYATIDERAGGCPSGLPAPGPRGQASSGGAHPVGRRLPHRGLPGRAGGPGAPRRLPPPALPPGRTPTAGGDRDHPARAAPGLRGPGGPPRRRALPPLFGTTVSPRCSGCGCRSWPTSWPTPRRGRASP